MVWLSCTGLPSKAICNNSIGHAGSPTEISVATTDVPPGDYQFNVVATTSAQTRSAPALLRVQDVTASFDPASGTLGFGQSMTSTLTLTAPNGFEETLNMVCYSSPNLTCSLSASSVTFGPEPTSRTVQVTIQAKAWNSSNVIKPKRQNLAAQAYFVFAPLFAIGLVLVRKRVSRSVQMLAMLAVLTVGLLSCGGGSSGAGGNNGGGTTPPPPPPPPPPPQTYGAQVVLTAPSYATPRYLAPITVTLK